VLLYGLETCALKKSQIASLDFVVKRFFMKVFNTNNIETVKACQEFFSLELLLMLSDQLAKRVVKFESKVIPFNSVMMCMYVMAYCITDSL